MRVVAILGLLTVCATAVAGDPPCDAPIAREDIRRIVGVIRAATATPILFIHAIREDHPVPGAVRGHTIDYNVKTGRGTPAADYIRTDLVSVYMRYADRARVDIYTVRKRNGRWRIEDKTNGFL